MDRIKQSRLEGGKQKKKNPSDPGPDPGFFVHRRVRYSEYICFACNQSWLKPAFLFAATLLPWLQRGGKQQRLRLLALAYGPDPPCLQKRSPKRSAHRDLRHGLPLLLIQVQHLQINLRHWGASVRTPNARSAAFARRDGARTGKENHLTVLAPHATVTRLSLTRKLLQWQRVLSGLADRNSCSRTMNPAPPPRSGRSHSRNLPCPPGHVPGPVVACRALIHTRAMSR